MVLSRCGMFFAPSLFHLPQLLFTDRCSRCLTLIEFAVKYLNKVSKNSFVDSGYVICKIDGERFGFLIFVFWTNGDSGILARRE